MIKSKLLLSVASAMVLSAAAVAYADDPVRTGPIDKFGRAIDDEPVKTAGPKKFGRELDDQTVRTAGPKKYGRELDDGTVRRGGPKQFGREVDEDPYSKTAKVQRPGRALSHEKAAKGTKQPIDQ